MFTLTLTPEQLSLVEDAFHYAGLFFIAEADNLPPATLNALTRVDAFRPWVTHPSILTKA
jgi:hypothetical protein